MTQHDRDVFIYELYLKMHRADIFEMMDPTSPSNKMIEGILSECDQEALQAIYQAKIPWLAARAFAKLKELEG